MKEKEEKILSIIVYTLLGISGILIVLFYLNAISENTILIWGYILLGLSVITVVAIAIKDFIKSPESKKNILFIFIGFLILLGISYLSASGNIQGKVFEKFGITDTVSRSIGTGLILTYILGIIAVLCMAFGGVIKMLKK
jgi:hypothetical protein